MAPAASRQFWESCSARLAARINLAVWLERFAPWAFGLCSVGAAAVYALRRQAGPEHWAWFALLAACGVTGAWAWWLGRSRCYARADARVLLESALRLDSRLSAAHDGVSAWPAPPTELPAIVRWRSLAAPGWLLAGLALLALGAWAPLAGSRPDRRPPVERPPALAQTEAMLQELARLEVADPTSLEQLETQARELASRPAEEQYTHSALEAADTLREQTMAAIHGLARGYDGAAAALSAAENGTGAARRGAEEELAAALDGLRTGRLAGHPDLLQSLGAAQAARSGLSAEQIEQLRRRLQQAGANARGIAGAAGAGAGIAQPGEGAGDGTGEGEGAGRGGVQRGRGDAPLTMTLDPSAMQDGRVEGVANDDLSRASLGDLTGTERGGAHRFDPSRALDQGSAGTVVGGARGGDAVWVDRLSPGDRAVLRDFYK